MKSCVPILVVDDRPINLVVVQSVLDSPEYRLVLVQSAQEALMALLEDDFAAVLLDVKMPETDGFALARLIRGRKLSRDLPIIFLSAHRTEPADVKLGYEVGAADYLTKPIDSAVLRAKVAVFADLYRRRAAAAEKTGESRPAAPRPKDDPAGRQTEAGPGRPCTTDWDPK